MLLPFAAHLCCNILAPRPPTAVTTSCLLSRTQLISTSRLSLAASPLLSREGNSQGLTCGSGRVATHICHCNKNQVLASFSLECVTEHGPSSYLMTDQGTGVGDHLHCRPGSTTNPCQEPDSLRGTFAMCCCHQSLAGMGHWGLLMY